MLLTDMFYRKFEKIENQEKALKMVLTVYYYGYLSVYNLNHTDFVYISYMKFYASSDISKRSNLDEKNIQLSRSSLKKDVETAE